MADENGSSWTAEVRSHVFDQIEGVRREVTMLINERSAAQSQRSQSQDKAVVDALDAAQKAVAAALAAAALAVDKAEQNAEKWRDNANEWRAAMTDRETRFLAKDEAQLMVNALSGRLDEAIARHDSDIGRLSTAENLKTGHSAGLSTAWGYALGFLSFAALTFGVIALIVHHP